MKCGPNKLSLGCLLIAIAAITWHTSANVSNSLRQPPRICGGLGEGDSALIPSPSRFGAWGGLGRGALPTEIALNNKFQNASPGEDRASDLDYETHLAELRKRIPTTDTFHITICKPFVVIGNESPEVVERRARDTVAWAVKRLQKQYFASSPDRIIDIWLFKDKATYEQYNEELFGAAPHTPFGYYSSARRALVMNIATGGGTLVHEIVHPFVEANFPDCPSWFNEGLASLYEQCSDRDGLIWGSTNWRLSGLQQAITDGDLPSFKELCSTTTAEFYNSSRGNNYAQARYLCYYLQENDLLEKYYREFVENREDDPSGYATLCRVLGDPDMDQFQQDWEKYVLRLRFP